MREARAVTVKIPVGGVTPSGRRQAEVVIGLGRDGVAFFMPLKKIPKSSRDMYLCAAVAGHKSLQTFFGGQALLRRMAARRRRAK
jgi:hypothetical protein